MFRIILWGKKNMRELVVKYRRPFWAGIAAGLVVIAVLLILGDLRGVTGMFKSFDRRYLPAILLLAPLNYFFRYLKWNYYLQLTGLHPQAKMNRLIFLSGLAMTITPGKVGELLKCYLLKEHIDAPVSVTASIVLAERLSDGLSMVVLAAVGLLAFPYGQYALLTVFILLIFATAIFHYEGFFQYLLLLSEKKGLSWGQKIVGFLGEFQQTARRLLTLPALLFAVGIGVLSWGLEGFVIFLAVRALGGSIPVLISIFVVSFSSLVGALSFLPGGLGAAEGSIMALLLLAGLGKEMAAAATLVTRFSTLWLGVLVGIFGFYLAQRELFKAAG
ncbi:MAG: lysylphosphatidylglycerol synthase transmembrane domain-containing protein [Dethiobacteria bacterium]